MRRVLVLKNLDEGRCGRLVNRTCQSTSEKIVARPSSDSRLTLKLFEQSTLCCYVSSDANPTHFSDSWQQFQGVFVPKRRRFREIVDSAETNNTLENCILHIWVEEAKEMDSVLCYRFKSFERDDASILESLN